jgi:putative membrane protein
VVFGGALGMAYLGTRGDIGDDHKDSGLATLGALIVTLVIAAVHAGLNRDFIRKWKDSLTLKHSEPLGEAAIEQRLDEHQPGEHD